MCGIVGQLSLGNSVAGARHEEGLLALAHRGPDEEGFWQDNNLFLGMRRLSIIDLEGGQQPIWNEDQTMAIIYNGELYNFLDLRPLLQAKGHLFRTRSDTEVVLHAYEEWGAACLRRFNGMFAFAIWDARRKVLFLARDRVGEKPIYYYQDSTTLIFASEIKAMLAGYDLPRVLNPQGLANFLAVGHSMAPITIYKGIFKLPPAHYLETSPGSTDFKLVEYWDVGKELIFGEEKTDLTGLNEPESEYAGRILDLLDDAVSRRMIADVPVGAFLSGGIDSSAIVALMKRHATGPLKTFSLGFKVGGAYNELSDARRVAEFVGTDHYELELEHTDMVETLRTLVYHYDEPFSDAASFPVYLLSRFARQQVKVVLTGDGGDELFGGYRRYAADQVAAYYQHLPARFITEWLPAVTNRLPRLRRIKRSINTLPIVDPGRRYAAWLTTFNSDMQAQLLQPDLYATIENYDPLQVYSDYYQNLNGTTASDHLNRLMYIDLKTWLADTYMEKVDKATMACSLEARLPLLDHRLVELAFQIPGSYKIKGWSTKRILKRAVRHLLPPEVMRKPKHGFAVPTDPWFRGELKSFTFEVLLDQKSRSRGYFNTPVIERLWRDHVEGRHVNDNQLWLLLNFELWHRIYLDRESV